MRRYYENMFLGLCLPCGYLITSMSKNLCGFVLSVLILSFFSSCGQSRQSKGDIYKVDSSVVSTINQKIAPFNGKSNASISFVMYEGDKAIISDDNTAALSFTSFSKNVVAIDCLNGTNDGFGFFLMLSKDSSLVNFKVLSRNESVSFKSSQQSAASPELLVKCVNSRVTLAREPGYVQGEVIEGIVELESEYFYEVRANKERKVKFRVEAYFKSEPVPVTNNQYKTLVK